MKKSILSTYIVVIVALAVAGSTYAVENQPRPRIENKINRIASTTENRMERMEDKKEKIASSTERRVGRIEKRIDRKETRITAEFKLFLTGLKNASTKLGTVIDRLSVAGKDMTDAKAKLGIANSKIAIAEVSVNTFDNLSLSLVATSTPTKVYVQEFRTMRATARADIQNAKKALNEALNATRKIEIRATSTTPVNASSTQ